MGESSDSPKKPLEADDAVNFLMSLKKQRKAMEHYARTNDDTELLAMVIGYVEFEKSLNADVSAIESNEQKMAIFREVKKRLLPPSQKN